MSTRKKIVIVIAMWMFAIIGFEIYKEVPAGLFSLPLPPLRIAELGSYGLIFLFALGLLFSQEWARKGTLLLFVGVFILSFYVPFLFKGPSFETLVKLQAAIYFQSYSLIYNIIIILFLTAILWPLFVILFLMHPQVKLLFLSRKKKEETESRAKETEPQEN